MPFEIRQDGIATAADAAVGGTTGGNLRPTARVGLDPTAWRGPVYYHNEIVPADGVGLPVPPTYRKVAVSVGLRVKPGFGVEAVRQWVELVLRQYLAPLPPYGPAGLGWPLGRRVHGPELEAAALQVEGVEFLEGLNVAGFDLHSEQWEPGSVDLAPFEVPELAEITVLEGPPAPAGQTIVPPPGKTPVPIPIIRQKC